ncbi:MAG: sigma-70 family RNA polymerase sigma factor [Bacteroidota bacterium]
MRWFSTSSDISDSSSDEELMQAVATGNTQAFDQLYERYNRKMLHYFYRMLNREEEKAQDMLQELFLKLVDKPHLFDPKRRFSTWIFAIASNMVKNEYRSREVRKIMSRPGDMSQLKVSVPSSEEALHWQSFGEELGQALPKLSEIHRETFVLRYQEELSIKEISEIMQCTEGTVKSRIFYALRKLAGHLHAFDPKENGI